MSEALNIIHNKQAQRFEAQVQRQLCVCDYHLLDRVMHMTHTFVPEALQGRGIAAQLVSAALAYSREQGYKVQPSCSYVRGYMQKHQEQQNLQI